MDLIRQVATRLAISAVWMIVVAVLFAAAGPLDSAMAAETIVLEPIQDTTIYSESGDTSNGAGSYLFCGVTNIGQKRRALLLFDVAGNVPAGATIVSAALELYVNKQPPGAPASRMLLYRSDVDWGEAGSDAADNEGQGAPAQPGDATWIYREYDTSSWTSAGGDILYPFVTSVPVTGIGPYVFQGVEVTTSVQDMLDLPQNNFGWFVLGDETQSRTALRLVSGEYTTTPQSRPHLTIEYEPKVPTDESSMGRLKSAYDD